MEHRFLPISVVRAAVAAAKDRRVSAVARSSRGFWPRFQAAGGAAGLSEKWRDKRNGFVARHSAPTNRHLALAVWAYSPQPQRLRAWLKKEGYL